MRVVPEGLGQFRTEWADARTLVHVNANPTLTNLKTGMTVGYRLRYASSEAPAADGASIVGQVSGEFQLRRLPG